MNGISSGASVDRVEMYGSDDPLMRGDCLYAYADREFVPDPDVPSSHPIQRPRPDWTDIPM